MFVGYNLQLDEWTDYKYLEIGTELYKNSRNLIKEEIKKFVNDDGSLNGTLMQNEWFPEVKADIFLSHSSKDKKLALTISGF